MTELKLCPGSASITPPCDVTHQMGVCPTCRRTVGRNTATGALFEHYQAPRRTR